ncbi:MAG: benzoate transporter [Lysobacterales bacterium CG02_land_8_20_14_3_00_62_12]|nr:MAG: benzoate transporter [Xanthomonadales bacterium CG02_land_8_20_14_3_00_62_12]
MYSSGTSHPISTRWSWPMAVLLAAAIAALNLGLWWAWNQPRALPEFDGKVRGVAYSAFQRDQSPLRKEFPSEQQLRSDLDILAGYSKRIRTYASTENTLIPQIAGEHGMRVTAGAWIDHRSDHNRLELDALYQAVTESPNIDAVMVGNESLFRQDVSVTELIQYLDEARQQLTVPVSTAEPWHLWLKYPELARHVDVITVHLLPYWEGVPRRGAMKLVLRRLHQIQKAFPGKRVVVGEVGWPSNGDRFRFAEPSVSGQASFIREWLRAAKYENIDYYLMEAFDQPWKERYEGRVGAYWGVFDAWRQPKFALTGPMHDDEEWWHKALLTVTLAFLPMLWFAVRFARFKLLGKIIYLGLIQLSVSLWIWLLAVPFNYYLDPLDWFMQALIVPAELAILAILLISGFEFVEVMWRRGWRREFGLLALAPADRRPKVSIHLACFNEPPEMVILTLDSLANLDYPDFEVLVVDNNTVKDEVWQPVAAHCAKLGARFRFFHLSPWPGFKAGALNFALKETAADAEVVAVVDADYAVEPNWLCDLVKHFEDTGVAIVQCPQAHREFSDNVFRRLCSFEYDGFFRIGMHHRNERDAIIQHGTMTMIRRSALDQVGGWAEWCICEDAELGLRLMEAGYRTNYVDHIMGRGLTPADFTAYKSQRFRWAFGAMQILRAHGLKLIGPSALKLGQRYHFLTGWFGWFANALHLLFTLLALGWTLGMLWNQELFSLPLQQFMVPVLGFSLANAIFGIWLYRVRVRSSWRDTLGASLASMALSHAIARGILKGLMTKAHPFERTAKSHRMRRKPSAWVAVREELLLLLALWIAIGGIAWQMSVGQPEAKLWMAILAAQSLPYFSAVATAWIASVAGDRLVAKPAAVATMGTTAVPMAVDAQGSVSQ